MIEKEFRLKPGYVGEDSQRTKAQKLLEKEFAMTAMDFPEGFNSPAREKVSLYRKGGPVKKVNKLTKEQTDLYIPTRKKSDYIKDRLMAKAQTMKTGGTPKLNAESEADVNRMKKGGRCNYAKGGTVNYEKEMMGMKPLKSPPSIKAKKMPGEFDASHGYYTESGRKKGGSIRRKEGGSVNYESEMRGTKPVSKPPAPKTARKDKGFDASHGYYTENGFKRGGRIKKLAAGGAAKVRKGMATIKGQIVR